MVEFDFLKDQPDGHGVITVASTDGTISRITNISPSIIARTCPLLSHAFDDGEGHAHRANIEASSKEVVVRFLRFLYTGTYLTADDEIGQCSLLMHAEVYKMAHDFNVPELQAMANCILMLNTEFSCSVTTPPLGLCDALRFVYKHLEKDSSFVDTLLNYCVWAFKYHGLGDDPKFRHVAFEVPEFHRDLCQTSMKRDFKDEGAAEIMLLPVCRSTPASQALFTMDKRTHAEFQFDDLHDSEAILELGAENKREEQKTKRRMTDGDGSEIFALVRRPKVQLDTNPSSPDSELFSEENGFTLVHRPGIITADGQQSAEYPLNPEDVAIDIESIPNTPVDGPDDEDEACVELCSDSFDSGEWESATSPTASEWSLV